MDFGFLQWSFLTLALAAFLISAAALILVIRWRVALSASDGERDWHVVPSWVVYGNVAAFTELTKRLSDFEKQQAESADALVSSQRQVQSELLSSDESVKSEQQRSFNALQAVLGTIKDLRDETKILRNEIQTQAAELERHRAGYDVDILSKALIPIARMHRLLRADLERTDLPDDCRPILEALEDEHLGVLETERVELVYPPVGGRYRDQKNIKHPPATEPAPDENAVGMIKAVIQPAYELETSAMRTVLLEAEVIVYSLPRSSESAETTEIE